MGTNRILFAALGVLGDLSWRKFIEMAREQGRRDSNVEILLVDIPWEGAHGVSPRHELHWRIGRRCIELMAERIDEGKVPGVSLKFDLNSRPLTWEVEDFFENYLNGTPSVLAAEKARLRDYVESWVNYFMETSPVTRMPRYASSINQVGGQICRLRDKGWKVILFVATPPQAYPSVINQWKYLADRIVLEKPACGLNPETLLYDGPDELLRAVSGVPPSTQVVTSDHYNAKSIVRAMDRLQNYGLFEGLLAPKKIRRIVVQLLEAAQLPLGRYSFYDGAGGPFGDMVPHLLQAVRAVLGLTPDKLKIRFGKNFLWAKYDAASRELALAPVQHVPYSYEPTYYRSLHPQTETFVAFDAELHIEGQPPIPLYCRTGKGFQSPRKSLRVDVDYDGRGSELSLLFEFERNSLTVRDERKGFVLAFGELSLRDPFESGVPGMPWEYAGIFDAIIHSEWTPDALDNRFFPTVVTAVELSSLIFQRLLAERAVPNRVLHSYSTADANSRNKILSFLDHQAHW